MQLRKILGTPLGVITALGIGAGTATPSMTQSVEQLRVEWNSAGGGLNCREQTYQVPFDAVFNTPDGVEPGPEWFSDGPGGFFLPEYLIELSSDGTYRTDTTLSIDDFRIESGLWSINDTGQLGFTCPEIGCDFTPPGTSESVIISEPDSVPVLGNSAEHLGGSYIAFYYSETRRLVCRTDDKTYKLKIPPVNDTSEPAKPTDNCDYTDAEVNGGWGWDVTTGMSCPPADDACDYTSAAVNDGWGWNPITASSCPPKDD